MTKSKKHNDCNRFFAFALSGLVGLCPLMVMAQPQPGYILQKRTQTRVEIRQKKAPALFKIKTGIFCTTPIESYNSTLISGCDDGTVRFVSKSGALIKTITIGKKDAAIASNPEIIALKTKESGTKSEVYVVTSYVDRLVMKFDASGNILSKTTTESDVSKPYGFGNADFFYIDYDGVGYFNHEGQETVKVSFGSSYLTDASTRVRENGDDEVIIGDSTGNLLVARSTGEVKKIKLSTRALGNNRIAPSGKVWVSDDSGMMYIVDTDSETIETFKAPLSSVFNRATFFKNGRVAFGAGDLIFIYDTNDLAKPAAIYDSIIHRDEFYANQIGDFLGTPMKGIDLAVVVLADGTENLWVPTYGGYHLIDDRGFVAGYLSFGAGLGDAESYSPPVKLRDGTFAMGLYCGIDRITISKSTTGRALTTGSWIRD